MVFFCLPLGRNVSCWEFVRTPYERGDRRERGMITEEGRYEASAFGAGAFLFESGGVSYIEHGYSSISSANRASVLPVNRVPPPLSSSSIEAIVSALGVSSGIAAPCR